MHNKIMTGIAAMVLTGIIYAQDIKHTPTGSHEINKNMQSIETKLETPKISYSNSLHVNRNKHKRHICKLGELEGINQIKKLVETSEYEEAWIYYPQDTLWAEFGLNESGWIRRDDYFYTKVSIDSNYITGIMDESKDIKIYHFHPIKNYPEEYLDEYIENVSDSSKKQTITALIYAMTALPSANDLNSMAHIEGLYLRKNPTGTITHRVVSYLGVSEYYLKEKGKEFVVSENNSIYVASETCNFFMGMLKEKVISNIPQAPKEKIEDICIDNIFDYLDIWENEFIDIEFFPQRSWLLINK